MFTALVVLIAASSMLSSAVKLAESGKRRLEAERKAGEVIALLVAGGADELSSFETDRRVIPGGVSVRLYSCLLYTSISIRYLIISRKRSAASMSRSILPCP